MVGYCRLFVSSSSNFGVQNVFHAPHLTLWLLASSDSWPIMPCCHALFLNLFSLSLWRWLHCRFSIRAFLVRLSSLRYPRRHKHLVYHSYSILFHRKRAAPIIWPYSHCIWCPLHCFSHFDSRIYNIPCITLIMVHTYTHTIHWCTQWLFFSFLFQVSSANKWLLWFMITCVLISHLFCYITVPFGITLESLSLSLSWDH